MIGSPTGTPAQAGKMEFWDKVKDSLGKTLTSVESHARDIKDTVDQELKIRKLKGRIEELKSEIQDLYREVGESVLESFRREKPVEADQFKQHLDYLAALEKKIRDVEVQLNEIYQETESDPTEDEIVVDPKDDSSGSE